MTTEIKSLEELINEKPIYQSFIGMKIVKKSKHPFKSGFKINTVKGLTINSYTQRLAFTFDEDESIVDCAKCKLSTEEDINRINLLINQV